MKRRSVKAQSALDFLTSYAVIILVVTVAVYAVLELGIFNPKLAPSYCNAAPGFTCAAYSIYTNGTMVFVLSQSNHGFCPFAVHRRHYKPDSGSLLHTAKRQWERAKIRQRKYVGNAAARRSY
jgi:hypothetical protein